VGAPGAATAPLLDAVFGLTFVAAGAENVGGAVLSTAIPENETGTCLRPNAFGFFAAFRPFSNTQPMSPVPATRQPMNRTHVVVSIPFGATAVPCSAP